MSMRTCSRKQELAEVLKAGHWPDACEASLREHVGGCSECSEQVLLTQAFKAARAEAVAHGTLYHPGTLWWRAQLRRRNEALQKLNQPTQWFSGIALLSMLVVLVGFLAWQRQSVAGWLHWLGDLSHSSSLRMESFWSGAAANWNWLLVLSCAVSLLLFGAVALFLSTNRE
jgi:hypothetical protein